MTRYECTNVYSASVYWYEVTGQSPRIAGNCAYLDVRYIAYSNGGEANTCNATPSIACDQYGNIY